MIDIIKNYLYEPKSKIGWVHGLLACFGALCCAYLTMMTFTSSTSGDYAYKIIPSIILTPVLMSSYGLFFLFTHKPINVLKKILSILFLLSIIFYLTQKVF